MPHYSADSADDDVAAQAYAAASKLTNNTTILLALFQAGLVESNFHNNTSATDHDSLGYLQQRPSQGWKDPTDIGTATKSFVDKAKRILAQHPNYSAAQLAQGVQVSAYPGRYGEASAAAQRLLSDASSGKLTVASTSSAASGSSTSPSGSITSGQDPGIGLGGSNPTDASQGKGWDAVAAQIFKLFLPSNLIRAACLIAGAFFIFFGFVLLAREMRNK